VGWKSARVCPVRTLPNNETGGLVGAPRISGLAPRCGRLSTSWAGPRRRTPSDPGLRAGFGGDRALELPLDSSGLDGKEPPE
jgi:hypothetical protein